MSHKNNMLIWSRGIKENSESNNMWQLFGLDKRIYYRVKRARQIIWLLGKKCWQGQNPSQFRSNHWNFSHVRASELFSERLFIKQCQSCGKNHPASPRASHYKTKEIEKNLSKLNFFYFLCFALLHFSRYFVVQPARQSRSARGRSSYRKELTYSHMQVNLRVYSELFSALLNIMSKNRAGSSARSSHLTHGHAPYRKEKL